MSLGDSDTDCLLACHGDWRVGTPTSSCTWRALSLPGHPARPLCLRVCPLVELGPLSRENGCPTALIFPCPPLFIYYTY